MKVIELNRPAVAKAIHNSDLSIKAYLTTYRYMDRKGVIHEATAKSPVYRYAKNSGERKDFAIIMISQEKNTKKIEEFFTELSKTVDVKPSSTGYTYLETYFGDRK